MLEAHRRAGAQDVPARILPAPAARARVLHQPVCKWERQTMLLTKASSPVTLRQEVRLRLEDVTRN